MLYVFAGSHQQYVEWSRDRMGQHTYIMSTKTIEGKKFNKSDVVYFGDYYRRPDYEDITSMLKWCTLNQDSEWERIKAGMRQRLVPQGA